MQYTVAPNGRVVWSFGRILVVMRSLVVTAEDYDTATKQQ